MKIIPNTICCRIVRIMKHRKNSLSRNFTIICHWITISPWKCSTSWSIFDFAPLTFISTTLVSFQQQHFIFRIPLAVRPINYTLWPASSVLGHPEAWWQERAFFDRTTTTPPETNVIIRYKPVQKVKQRSKIYVNLSPLGVLYNITY